MSQTSKYFLASLAAETDETTRRRVITACDMMGVEFSERALLSILLKHGDSLTPVVQTIGATAQISDSQIVAALREISGEDDEPEEPEVEDPLEP